MRAQISFAQNLTPGLSGLSSFRRFGSHLEVDRSPPVRLDTLLAGLGVQRVDFLKVDTEGSDFDVLKAYDFERLPPPLIFVEYSYFFPSQTPAVVRQAGLEFMRQLGGYRALIFDYDDDGNFKAHAEAGSTAWSRFTPAVSSGSAARQQLWKRALLPGCGRTPAANDAGDDCGRLS